MHAIGVLAAETGAPGGALGFVAPVVVLAVLGLVVARSLRRQRAYEQHVVQNPDGQPPADERDPSDDSDPPA
ncbi:hypothetical protein [Egicoccus sp. AB-alg6-2]|uniref:hypothetical protein n=1 Tax=Egicoccus sp. AB-alg6-2 TaxID=3242692 RepID=UPI00359DFDE5